MKRFVGGLGVVVALLLTSCEVRFDWPWLKDQPQHPSDPDTTVIQDRNIGDFDQVEFEGIGRLVFDPSIPAGTIRVEAEAKALDAVKTEQEGSTLVIREEGMHVPGATHLTLRVAPPAALKSITLQGLGSVEAPDGLSVPGDLEIHLDGMGKIEALVHATRVLARQQGQGELKLRGEAGTVIIEADGVGRVDTSELITKTAEVTSKGLGEVVVYASERLKVRADGVGAVSYKGHPAQTDVQTEGLTKVKPLD